MSKTITLAGETVILSPLAIGPIAELCTVLLPVLNDEWPEAQAQQTMFVIRHMPQIRSALKAVVPVKPEVIDAALPHEILPLVATLLDVQIAYLNEHLPQAVQALNGLKEKANAAGITAQ